MGWAKLPTLFSGSALQAGSFSYTLPRLAGSASGSASTARAESRFALKSTTTCLASSQRVRTFATAPFMLRG